jgi:hypothetical protein
MKTCRILFAREGIRPEHAVEMYRLIPHAQLAVFPGGDHFMLFSETRKSVGAIGVVS